MLVKETNSNTYIRCGLCNWQYIWCYFGKIDEVRYRVEEGIWV